MTIHGLDTVNSLNTVNSMNTIKSLFDDIKVEELFQVAFDFSLSKSHIEKYEREYEENKNNPNNEFIKQL